MEDHKSQNQAWRLDLTETLVYQQQAQLSSFPAAVEAGQGVLYFEQNGTQMYQAGTSREIPNGRKRRGRIPTQTPEEKRMKKNLADRKSRKKHKEEFTQMKAIMSKFGGVEICEHEFSRFEQMKYKFGGIEEMEYKLDIFNKIASMLGGVRVDKMETEIIRLKNIELQRHIESEEQMGCLMSQNGQASLLSLEQDYHEMQSANFNNQVQRSMVDWQQDYHGMQFVNFNNQVQGSTSKVDLLDDYEISDMFLPAESGTMPDIVCSDPLLSEPVHNVMSLYGFNDFQGECESIGKNTFRGSMVSNLNGFLDYPSDVTGNPVCERNFMAESEAMPDIGCSDAPLTERFPILDVNVMSLNGFNDLQEETLPWSFVSN